jgi:hypothetical protein
MRSHVAPERWAELAAGRLTSGEGAALVAHADACARCARVRRRVDATRATLALLHDAPPPPLPWDRIGAQRYGSTSLERRRPRRRPRAWPILLAGLAAGSVAVVAATLWLPGVAQLKPVAVVAPAPLEAPAPPPVPAPPVVAPAPLEAAVTFLQGQVTVDGGAAVTGDTPLRAGLTLHAAAGARLAAQFGARSGLVLEPGSTLEVLRFDAGEVLLRVTSGAVAVELEERRPDQRFAVLAGTRVVEVRGTVFRVAEQAGDVDVAVRRGRVAVLDSGGAAETNVLAGTRLALARGAAPDASPPVPSPATLDASMRIPLVPGFESAAAMRADTPMLAVTAPARASVRVDGVEAGVGSFQLRRALGRHLVESGTVSRWVEVTAGGTAAIALAPPAAERNRSERPAQLDAQLRNHRGELEVCASRLGKVAPGGELSVEVEVGVRADGSVDFVTPVGRVGDDCVLDLIRDRFTFPEGAAATVRKSIRLQ